MNRNSQFATENKVDENYKKNSERQKNYLINFNYNNENI